MFVTAFLILVVLLSILFCIRKLYSVDSNEILVRQMYRATKLVLIYIDANYQIYWVVSKENGKTIAKLPETPIIWKDLSLYKTLNRLIHPYLGRAFTSREISARITLDCDTIGLLTIPLERCSSRVQHCWSNIHITEKGTMYVEDSLQNKYPINLTVEQVERLKCENLVSSI